MKIEKRVLYGKTKHIVFDCMLAETLKLLVMYSFTWCASLKKRGKKNKKVMTVSLEREGKIFHHSIHLKNFVF